MLVTVRHAASINICILAVWALLAEVGVVALADCRAPDQRRLQGDQRRGGPAPAADRGQSLR